MRVALSPSLRVPFVRLLPSLLLAGSLLAAQSPPARPVLRPTRVETPPILDGVLDDLAWAQAAAVTDFVTFIPEFGKPQAERTIAYAAYDRDHLYFAFRCLDPEPGRIKAAVARRDDILNDDFVCVNLDSFNDQQSLYGFYVNPLGIQADSRFANNKEDFGVDLVWDSAGRLDAEGYCVEIRIPLKSLRFTAGAVVRMAVLFERTVSRRKEHGSFPVMDPKRGYAFLPQMAVLEYPGLRGGFLLELLPALTHARRAERLQGAWAEPPPKTELSLTAKVGLTPSLVLDATLNPDFSQVEADAGQVDANLRYNLFFAEKRPFFQEGSESFNTGGTASGPLSTLVHTRTIVDPEHGAKLSGKLGPRDTIAVLEARDKAADGGPDAGFAVLRYKRGLAEDSYLGAFATRRAQGPQENLVAGPDGQLRLGPASTLAFHAFGSRTEGAQGLAPRRGRALGLEYQLDSSRLGAQVAVHDLDRDFRTDVGYLTRTGLTSLAASLTPRFYPGRAWLRRIDPTFSYARLRDHDSGLREHAATVGFTAYSQGNTTLGLFADDATEVYLGRVFQTSGWRLNVSSQVDKRLSLKAALRAGQSVRYSEDPFQARGTDASASAVLQPTENLNLALNWSHADLRRQDDGSRVFDGHISRARLTYQVNAHLFFRVITEYNAFRRQRLTDLLASFTYIPGTVVFLGYGNLQRRQAWDELERQNRDSDRWQSFQRGLFFKASYLWRY